MGPGAMDIYIYIYTYIFEKIDWPSTLVIKIIKKKGTEDRDTKTSLLDDVYLQVCHVIYICIYIYIYI